MTDEELAAIVQRRCDYEATVDDIDALVAEVRRLRGLRLTMHVMREGIVEAYMNHYGNIQMTVRDP